MVHTFLKQIRVPIAVFFTICAAYFFVSCDKFDEPDHDTIVPDGLVMVNVNSSLDGSQQPAYFHSPKTDKPVPLIVSLHTWGGDYAQKDNIAEQAIKHEVAYIHPDIRGRMNNPKSCCSDFVISDIEDAIGYAIKNSKIDPRKIYITGASGGGYTTLCAYMKIRKYNISKFVAWIPFSDLGEWYHQTKVRKQKQYYKDIEFCTKSHDGRLDVQAAKKRSPIYWDTPVKRLDNSHLDIYAGSYDGIHQNGSVPISQSINFFNKIVEDSGGSTEDIVSDEDKLSLYETERPIGDFGAIEDRKIFYRKSFKGARLTIFEGGHEKEPEYVFDLLVNQ
ncbi:dienelactone hydrolase [Porphyrobacter sp. MBR-155]|uniref:alpha/beta hydrolase family protein n=1 Tax=Porphyrobacter sp. MBR-155 TaxID=3156464 RepID=UPI0033932756